MARKPRETYAHSPMYEQLLLFPERAEYLAGDLRFHSYRVRLEHWKTLESTFREAFETVYERGSARVLLVHGGQGHGKSLFVQTLETAFKGSEQATTVDPENLWHALAGGVPPSVATIQRATQQTAMRRVIARTNWLENERNFAQQPTHRVRIFLFDDAQKDPFVREWASLSQESYSLLKTTSKSRWAALDSVAERIVEDCRGDFRRAIFVLFSNDPAFLDELKLQLDRSHQGLALRVELPLPEPAVKEEIVRTNTNLLNPRSYWFCLDQGGPEEKRDAYTALKGDQGFLDSFQSISRALAAQQRARRSGRPANKNLITLVTLGSTPAEVTSFLDDHEMVADEQTSGSHVGVWTFRNRWASQLTLESSGNSRRASLVESEFSLRWVALDMVATWVICEADADDALAAALITILRTVPSIGDGKETKTQQKLAVDDVNAAVQVLVSEPRCLAFRERFAALGQQRSHVYEPAVAKRLAKPLSRGLRARTSLKPDVILEEYEPCAVTSARDPKEIEAAIKRSCHVIEMTAHLQADMRGLDAYLADKVNVYAELLESV